MNGGVATNMGGPATDKRSLLRSNLFYQEYPTEISARKFFFQKIISGYGYGSTLLKDNARLEVTSYEEKAA